MNTVWQFSTASSIKFGRGSRNELAAELSRRNLARPLIVTDPTLAALPIVQQIFASLQNAVVFQGGQAEPAIAIADAAISCGQDAKVDSVIGIGGGSNLDVAKISATVLQHGGQPSDYFGFDQVPGPILPTFALPTTAGTGSEVSHSAVLTDDSAGVKVSTLSGWLRPNVAIVDPAMTDSCPARVTAESGIDALVHAVEAYTNRSYQEMVDVDPQARAYEGSYPFTQLLASEAIRLIGAALVPTCRAPTESLRDQMAWAATLAGMAFSNSGVGIVHALEYPIGALTHCGHGEGNGLLLPHVMRYNRPVREQAFAEIAVMLGAPPGQSTSVLADAAIDLVCELQNKIGIRTRLQDLGLAQCSIPEVAKKAFQIKRLMDINAQPPSEEHLVEILQAAF